MAQVCIIIPIYKNKISAAEKKSLLQCCSVLNNYTIYFICPASLDTSGYKDLMINHPVDYHFIKFSDNYFKDIHGYNKLMISRNFIKQIKHKFFLIYQLDAWVFRDDLIYWCSKGYDYIGAPWVDDYANNTDFKGFIGVGNGGFSLRKTKSILKVLYSFSLTEPIKDTLKEIKGRKTFLEKLRGYLKAPYLILLHHNTFYLLNRFKGNEDVFWGRIAKARFNWFKVAPIKEALEFSFEMYPKKSFDINNKELPFGCHAWEKYDPEFWKAYIDKI